MFQVVHRLIPRDWGYGEKFRTRRRTRTTVTRIYWRRFVLRLGCCMAKKPEPVDNLLDALVWMRRKAKKHEAVDDLIDALMKMRHRVKKKTVKKKSAKKKSAKKKSKKRRSRG